MIDIMRFKVRRVMKDKTKDEENKRIPWKGGEDARMTVG